VTVFLVKRLVSATLPITALVESPTNPRRRFSEERLQELAASFQSQGILAPLLVREVEESKYEVIAGARRLRGAKLAALDTVPVCVVALSATTLRVGSGWEIRTS